MNEVIIINNEIEIKQSGSSNNGSTLKNNNINLNSSPTKSQNTNNYSGLDFSTYIQTPDKGA